MTVQDRINKLRLAVKEQNAQRAWLLEVDWQDSHGDASRAAMEHDEIIAMYEKLIRSLEARL